MTIQVFVCNPYQENTFIVYDERFEGCYIIDPGMYGAEECERVRTFLEEKQWAPKAILITHAHPDHICGLEYLKQLYPNLPVVDSEHMTACNQTDWESIVTPGHKEDAICFYFKNEGVLFSGDTLFRESIGRTDLPGGDWMTLMGSLNRLTQTLPPETVVYPGHGPQTTLAYEKQHNPFLR